MDPGPGRELEASLAADPRDPATAIVTWTNRNNDATVWAGVTRDGGTHWRTMRLHDPALQQGPIISSGKAFDSVARFGPDGTAYVLYGGEEDYLVPGVWVEVVDRITLARSTDQGTTWTYHTVSAETPPHGWDYMDLAIAPDTGSLYVVAHDVWGPAPLTWNGVYAWRSLDQGTTWKDPTEIYPFIKDGRWHFMPRVVAAPGGLVVVKTQSGTPHGDYLAYANPDQETELEVSVSRDGGATFGPPQRTVVTKVYKNLVGTTLGVADGRLRLDMAVPTQGGILLTGSTDLGRTWKEKGLVAPNPQGLETRWVTSALGADGSLYLLHPAASRSPARWEMVLTRVDSSGAVEHHVLAGPADACAPPCATLPGAGGDDYGGLDFGPDGSLWAAWSDPRGRDRDERIAVVHLSANGGAWVPS